MEPPGAATGAVPVGAVKAGDGIAITAEGVISTTKGGGTINNIICTNGIQGGGGDPQVFIGLLPPTETTIGGVYTVDGSGISIDANGLIRASLSFGLQAGPGIVLSNVSPESATISTSPAGTTEATRGTVFYEPVNNPGVTVDARGSIRLVPPIGTGLGGVRAGTGVTIDPVTGVLNATGTGGTITAVGAGTGLGGGGSTGAVSLFLKPPSGTTIGGVYAGENITIDPDGKVNVSDAALGVLTVSGEEPIYMLGTPTNPVVAVRSASTTQEGVVFLSDSITSTSSSTAATSLAVQDVYLVASGALQRSGGAMTGDITFNAGQTFPGTIPASAFTQKGQILVAVGSGAYLNQSAGGPGQVLSTDMTTQTGLRWITAGTGTVTEVTGDAPIQVATGTSTPVISITAATTTDPGAVQLENSVTSISETTAPTSLALSLVNTVAEAALPKAGGTMTGAITFAGAQNFPGVLPLGGGTLTGAVTFAAGQTFPGVLADGSISGTGALEVGGTPSNPVLSVDTATTAQLGVVQPDGTTITVDGNGVISAVSGTGGLPLSGGTMTGDIVFAGTQTFAGVLPLTGGNLTGSLGINTPTPLHSLHVGGDIGSYGPSNLWTMNSTSGEAQIILQNNGVNSTIIRDDPTGSTDIITNTSALRLGAAGVEKIEIGVNGDIWLGGDIVAGTPLFDMNGTTGQLTINANTAGALTFPIVDGGPGQTLTTDGTGQLYWATNVGGIPASLLDVTGDMVYASATNTPASLPIGANGSILAVNAGLPAWRTTTQLGLLTSAAAATTYAPLDNPTFTGPVTVSAGGGAGANALVVSGGNLVLATSYTPPSSSSTGSIGELAWDSDFLYFCYAPNTWGRVAVDLTPF